MELCVKALQLPKQDDSETRISVCKTVSCLLPDDLEVLRACQLTEFLLGPSQEVYDCLEELYKRPDQKYDQENGIIPNSLRCELLLALKAHWPFDPEFWDWKTLKYHCVTLLGGVPESEGEEEVDERQERVKPEPQGKGEKAVESEHPGRLNGNVEGHEEDQDNKKVSSKTTKTQGESSTKKHKIICQICNRPVTDTQILHHSKRHAEENNHPCPVCLEKFQSRKELMPHMKQHVQNPASFYKKYEKNKRKGLQKDRDEDELEPGEISVDPSLMQYYQSTHDPDVLHHIVQQAKSANLKRFEDDEYVTFDYIDTHYNLQNRDDYPCPGTHCTKTFKHSKYLYVHLKSEHKGDENVRHFHQMRDKREKCMFCRRHLVSAYHHRKHRKVHCGDQPFKCMVIGCGAEFSSSNELVSHKQTHGYQLNYQCELEGCYVTFSELGQMYHHEAQHFRDAAFSCTSPECKKFYLSKKEFIQHLATHGITFSEEDLETQRKAKRKLLETVAEETDNTKKSSDSKTVSEEMVNGHDLTSSTSCASSSHASNCEEPKEMMTSVAVCFDGSKFTCGFEKCGMTFSRARDVQRHLKCAHPEHLKLENKEHKHDKEQGSKPKGLMIKTEPNIKEKGQHEHSTPHPSKGTGKERKALPHPSHDGTNSSSLEHNDDLREIVIGLSKLNLNSSGVHNGLCEPSDYISGSTASQVSLHQAIMARPPVVLLQKKALSHLTEERVKVKSEQASETDEMSDLELLAIAKPYICKRKGCNFRTAQSFSLSRHYKIVHGHTLEQAKKMTSLKTTSFKPYVCQICFSSLREKGALMTHYFQMHNLTEAALEKINWATQRHELSKTLEPTKHMSQPLTNHARKIKKREGTNWQQRYHRRQASMMTRENRKSFQKHSPSEEDEAEDRGEEEESEQKGESENGMSKEGRATRRLVTKGNLCYILTKFNKPFRCVVKDCDAAFSNQGGLVRHLQFIHRYNRSQLSVEKDLDMHKNSEVRGDPAKKRPVSHSDEPQPQYRCGFTNCDASYHLKSSLVRHTRLFHCQPQGPIGCKYEGCTSVFSHASALKNHILYSHCEYYNSLVLRLQSTHKKSISGCQKKLIVTPPSPQKEVPELPTTQSLRLNPKCEKDVQTEETGEGDTGEKVKVSKNNRREQRYDGFVFRSHEEALQMCQDRCLPYACMVQDCDSVVKYLNSMQRHYMRVHRMCTIDFRENEDKLIFTAEQLEELIQRKSARPTSTASCTPNGVRKMEYQAEPENPGGTSAPMSLHSIKTETLDKDDHDSLGFPEEEPPLVERNNVLVAADDVLYGEPSTGGHTGEPAAAPQNGHIQEEKPKRQNTNPSLPTITVDLSPPASLRFTVDEGIQDTSSSKDGGKMNRSVPLPVSLARQPLKRKNELSEQPSNLKDTQPHCPPPFDIATYKPMGFESSFLKFIQESNPSKGPVQEEDMTPLKQRDSYRRSCSVKENNQMGTALTRSKRTRSHLPKPLPMTGNLPSVQNLKSILDKALAGCGDLAIKQLQYLRPVVVLERPVCSTTLPDLFSSDINNSKLLLGS